MKKLIHDNICNKTRQMLNTRNFVIYYPENNLKIVPKPKEFLSINDLFDSYFSKLSIKKQHKKCKKYAIKKININNKKLYIYK